MGIEKHVYDGLDANAIKNIFHNGETHAKYIPAEVHEPIESIDKNSVYYKWMKSYKDDIYGKSVR